MAKESIEKQLMELLKKVPADKMSDISGMFKSVEKEVMQAQLEPMKEKVADLMKQRETLKEEITTLVTQIQDVDDTFTNPLAPARTDMAVKQFVASKGKATEAEIIKAVPAATAAKIKTWSTGNRARLVYDTESKTYTAKD